MRQPGADAREFRAVGGGAGIWDPDADGAQPAAPGPAGVPAPRQAATPSEAHGEDPLSTDPPGQQAAAPPGERADARTRLPPGEQAESRPRLPPGQYVQANMPVLHYGPVPSCNLMTWDLRVYGATEAGREHRWTWDEFRQLRAVEVIADFHCVTKFSVLGITWLGVPSAEILRAVPPSPAATHVMIWAEYGYGANLPIEALAEEQTLLATHRDGRELAPEQGYPVRLVIPSRYGWKNVKWVRAIEYMAGDRRGFWEERGYHNNADPWHEQRYSYQELPGEGPELWPGVTVR